MAVGNPYSDPELGTASLSGPVHTQDDYTRFLSELQNTTIREPRPEQETLGGAPRTREPRPRQAPEDAAIEAAVSEEALGQHNLLSRLFGLLAPHAPALQRGAEELSRSVEEGRPRLTFSREELEEAVNIFSNPATFTGRVAARRFNQQGRTTPSFALDLAQQLEREGVPEQEIVRRVNIMLERSPERQRVGTITRSVEGDWRLELNDRDAHLFGNVSGIFRQGHEVDTMTGPLSRVLDHPNLLGAYPELRNVEVTISRSRRSRGGTRGTAEHPTIFVEAPTAPEARDILLHEIQHMVQFVEGFSPGTIGRRYFQSGHVGNLISSASSDQTFRETFIRSLDRVNVPTHVRERAEIALVRAFNTRFTPSAADRAETLEDVASYFRRNPHLNNPTTNDSFAFDLNYAIYYMHAGEQEAARTAARSRLSPQQRRETPESLDESRNIPTPLIPRQEHIVAPPAGVTLNPARSIEVPRGGVSGPGGGRGGGLTLNRELLDSITGESPVPRQYVETYLSNVGDQTMQSIHRMILDEVQGTRLATRGWTENHLKSLSNRIKAETGVRVRPALLRNYLRAIIDETGGTP